MIVLRSFSDADALALQRLAYPDLPIEKIKSMISEWNQKSYDGSYFEMFAIVKGEIVVGMISLYGQSAHLLGIGPEVFEAYRKQGIATEAMRLALEIAKEKGYRVVSQQIRTNNLASLALHESLGFETNGKSYINQKGNEVVIYLKALI